MNNIFVYGSLKQGYWNHHYLEKESVNYLGTGYIKGYKLYKVASFPGMKKTYDEDEVSYGEIYSVDDETLKEIDLLEYEGYLYKRIMVNVSILDKNFNCFAYEFIPNIDYYSNSVDENVWHDDFSDGNIRIRKF